MRIARNALATGVLAVAAGCLSSPAPELKGSRISIVSPDLTTPREDLFRTGGAPPEEVARAVFEQINHDRLEAGLPAVLWDEEAARAASRYVASQIAEKSYGHFLTDAVPPYARFSRAGVFGATSENASAAFSSDGRFTESPRALALKGQQQMLAEKPPEDGHRRTILDPAATHVGVGWAMSGGDFRMIEEFVTRRFEWLRVSKTDPTTLRVKGRARPGDEIAFVSVSREPTPARLPVSELAKRRSYSYPNPVLSLSPAGSFIRINGTSWYDVLVLGFDRRFSFRFKMDEPGLWTYVLYFGKTGKTQPGGSISVWVN